jgi:glycine/serine hydroxymethyltransferase
MKRLADWMNTVINAPDDDAGLEEIRLQVSQLCSTFPAPGV